MSETVWHLDEAIIGGVKGRGLDDAAHGLGVIVASYLRPRKATGGRYLGYRQT